LAILVNSSPVTAVISSLFLAASASSPESKSNQSDAILDPHPERKQGAKVKDIAAI
jgi:hypothetical protein